MWLRLTGGGKPTPQRMPWIPQPFIEPYIERRGPLGEVPVSVVAPVVELHARPRPCCLGDHASTLKSSMTENARRDLLWIWHVGSRGGFVPVAFPAVFDDSVGILMIDADPSVDGLTEQPVLLDDRHPACAHEHRCMAAWSADADVQVHFTACPFATGTRQLDPRFRDWYVFGNGNVDYVLGAAHEVRRTETMAARRLDSLASGLGPAIARPGILSIDAQGASAEILEGAEALLADSVDAIVCEAETIPFYGGSPSLSLLLPHLAERRFFLSGFVSTGDPWASPCRNPIGLRGRPLLGSVDALFVRDPLSLADGACPARIARYAFVACMVGHPDLALAALMRWQPASGPTAIERFACELREAATRVHSSMPPTFGTSPSRSAAATAHLPDEETLVERCLASYGFLDAANDLRMRRLRESAHACSDA